jgi:hypothetical protein
MPPTHISKLKNLRAYTCTDAGELTATKTYAFDFENVDKQYDSYNGINVKLRYFLRVTVSRQYSPNIVQEMDLWVKNVQQAPVSTRVPANASFKFRVSCATTGLGANE